MSKYRLKKLYPGLNEGIKVGDIFESKKGCGYFTGNIHNTEWVESYFQNKEFFELIQEPKYEILNYIGSNGRIYPQYHTTSTTINSVKRLSDGVIFTIGDRVRSSRNIGKTYTITLITIDQKSDKIGANGAYDGVQNIWFEFYRGDGIWIDTAEKLIPLFQSWEGDDIYEGDPIYFIGDSGFPIDFNTECVKLKRGGMNDFGKGNIHEYNGDIYWVKFSKMLSAQNFIINHNPILSIGDIFTLEVNFPPQFQELLQQLVKSKIK